MNIHSAMLCLWLTLPATACELLIKYSESAHTNVTEDVRGRAKRGMVVAIKEDGQTWGARERLTRFAVIKIPGVLSADAFKYLAPEMVDGEIYRYRRWQFLVPNMPVEWQEKLATDGLLTVKATLLYSGDFDCFWDELRQYLYDHETDTFEQSRFVLVLR
jgi:hypothetical protein